MRKFVYLCVLMTLCFNLMAQIDLNDKNWDTLFIEDFSVVRTWSKTKWQDGTADSTSLWRCFSDCNWPDGVTTNHKKHRQAYQPKNAVFCTDSTMKLIGEFRSQDAMECGHDTLLEYLHAPWSGTEHYCAPLEDQHPSVHYHAGTIETINPVGFGYYELECKMPVHDGANTSFWFWSTIGGTYNEIDVFEHATEHCKDTMERKIISGIWFNPDSTNLYEYYDTVNHINYHPAEHNAETSFLVPASRPLNEYHTFGCLWLPDYVAFYCDGEKTNELTDANHIPQHSMYLKITHKEDYYAYDAIIERPIRNSFIIDTIWWEGNDTVTISHVKALRLKTDCETDAVIRSDENFSNYSYGVKRSITMGANTGVLSIPNDIGFTMRAVNSIVIDKGFEVPVGASMTLITQECPYCSDD